MFAHIDECIEGTQRLLRSNFAGPVSIGSEEMVSINQLVALVSDIAGKPVRIRHVPGPQGVRGRNSDNQLLQTPPQLGAKPAAARRPGTELRLDRLAGRQQSRAACGLMQALAVDGIPSSLLRRKDTILCSGLAAAAVALAVARVLPVSFSVEGYLAVDSRGANGETDVASRADVLQSAALIRRVIEQLHLDASADLAPAYRVPAAVTRAVGDAHDRVLAVLHSAMGEAARGPASGSDGAVVDYIKKHLHVEAKERSTVLALNFRARSPEVAAAVVDALMEQYLAAERAGRDQYILQLDAFLERQAAAMRDDLTAAEQRVEQFVAGHSLPEVGGSTAATVLLSRDQEQLALARQDLARRQASVDTILRTNGSGLPSTEEAQASAEAQASRTIVALKSAEAQASLRLAELSAADPRRKALQDGLVGIRVKINTEAALVASTMVRDVLIARAKVQALELAVRNDTVNVQHASVGGSTLAQLRNDVADKRTLYLTLLSST